MPLFPFIYLSVSSRPSGKLSGGFRRRDRQGRVTAMASILNMEGISGLWSAVEITLPRRIHAAEFSLDNPPEGCFAACFIMVLIYWRISLNATGWKVPSDPNSPDWFKIGRHLFKEARIGGITTQTAKEKTIKPLLKKIGASDDLEYRDETFEDVLESARQLASRGVPTIIFYDLRRLQKGIDSGGAIHSSIFLYMDREIVKVTDPANVGSLGYQTYTREQLNDAMSKVPKNLAFLVPVRHIKITSHDVRTSLARWLSEGVA